jgi:hypothetical protein
LASSTVFFDSICASALVSSPSIFWPSQPPLLRPPLESLPGQGSSFWCPP